MSFSNISSSVVIIILAALVTSGIGTSVIEIQNNCDHDVWAAAVPGGGKHLLHNQIWRFSPPNKKDGKENSDLYVWGRTNCTFDDMGRGKCATGDCDGLFNCDDNFFNGSDWSKAREFATSAYFMFYRFDMRDLFEMDNFGIWFPSGYNIPMQLTAIFNQRPASIIGFKYAPGNCSDDVEGCDKYCTIVENKGRCYHTCQNKLEAPSFCPPKDPLSIIAEYALPSGENQYKVLFCP